MSRQFWAETLTWLTSTPTAVTNTTTETIIAPNVTIPANYLQDGRCLRLRMIGSYGTGTGPPTLIFTIRWGGVAGTVLSKSGAIATTASFGGGASMTALWSLEAFIQTRANGSAGSLMTNGEVMLYSATIPTGGTVTNYGMPAPIASGSTGGSTPVAVTADLTADTALSLTATWSASSTAHSIQALNYSIEAMN
jgi:hypothetical protein